MTLNEIQSLVVSMDPQAGHYESDHREGEPYTVWYELFVLDLMSDDHHEDAWAFHINRYTKQENDPIAAAFFATLDSDDRIAFEYRVDYEQDTGYIHHIFDCEG